MYTLSAIYIYPIKSLGGIALKSSIVEERGLKYDRGWMLVDKSNTFVTQRDFPEMALISVSLLDDALQITHKTKTIEPLMIPFDFNYAERAKVIIWKDKVEGEFYNNEIDEWFSQVIGMSCHLVKMPDSTKRFVDEAYAKNKTVSFADGFPFLLIGLSSLQSLTLKLKFPVQMNRFRPNLVFNGGKPFEEDEWKDFKIGDVNFRAVKPCARCIITRTNQETANRTEEPLLTLSKFRKVNNRVLFGMNLICEGTGSVNVGDKIKQISNI